MKIELSPIGYVRSPFMEPSGVPIQTKAGNEYSGTVEVLEGYADGLADLDGFSHIFLLTYLHRSKGYDLKVIPFLDDVERGVFSTRAPRRPNPIGLHLVRLERVEGNILHIRDIDMIDGTPVLDIKPYIPKGDERENYRLGWLTGKIEEFESRHSDDRFDRRSGRSR
ncbi:MAG: tRNA (N6-threonylcarbamoyladenosine(37)-N6)-methyltransferase TrmO [Candidatus Thermoplasmatota archaeon]|nr:tRNA (N6-threonylcarbamoyladenosine(37)-N6)-methyltransferase TrmO [Candidatus Thermoplasmatota archaeon]